MILFKKKEAHQYCHSLKNIPGLLNEIHLLMETFCIIAAEVLRNFPVFNHAVKYPLIKHQLLPAQLINGTVF